MNAQELFHESGKTASVYYCSVCRHVAKDRQFAERCCTPRKCEECGCDIPYKEHRTVCISCAHVRRSRRLAELLLNAEEVHDYDGWVYVEGMGYRNGYFESVEELLEYCDGEEVEPPAFAFCCKASHFSVDHEKVIEQAEQQIELDCCEDYEPSYSGVKEFAAACEAFSKANQSVCTYFEDYKRKVRVNA